MSPHCPVEKDVEKVDEKTKVEKDLENAFLRASRNSIDLRTSAAPDPGFIVRPPEIIASGELNCWPDKSLRIVYFHYSEGMTMRYLNSGFLLGSASAFLRLFQAKPFTGTEKSGQRYFTQASTVEQQEQFDVSVNRRRLSIRDGDHNNQNIQKQLKPSTWSGYVKGKWSSKGSRGFAHPLLLHLAHNKDIMQQALQQLHGNECVEE
jgi:hypothetical protein